MDNLSDDDGLGCTLVNRRSCMPIDSEKIAEAVRVKIAKAVFIDKVSTRDIETVEHNIIKQALDLAIKQGRESMKEDCLNCCFAESSVEMIHEKIAEAIRKLEA